MTLPIEDELARRGITLKRVRPDLSTCPCPKCGQRLNVFPRRNAFACSGCGKGGDSADMFITFLDGEKAKPKTNGNGKHRAEQKPAKPKAEKITLDPGTKKLTGDEAKQLLASGVGRVAEINGGPHQALGLTFRELKLRRVHAIVNGKVFDAPCGSSTTWFPIEGEQIDAEPEIESAKPADTLTVASPVAAEPKPIIVHTAPGIVEAAQIAPVLTEDDIKAEIERLAGLSDLQYQTMREASARALNIRASKLDRYVLAARKSNNDTGDGLEPWWSVEPWPEPVEINALLKDMAWLIGKHVICPYEYVLTSALWSVFAWCHDSVATHSPILAVTSPESQSGKSTLLGVISFLIPRAIVSVEIKGASLYRSIELWKPSFVIDEFDDMLAGDNNPDLRSVINSGHTRNQCVIRCVEPEYRPKKFQTFSPKALGLNGRKLPGPTLSRCIFVELKRRKPDEHIEPFEHEDSQELGELRRKLLRWSTDNAEALRHAKNKVAMPEGFNNRIADNWRVLFAVADLAGAEIAEHAREAAIKIEGTGESGSIHVRVLADIRTLYYPKDDEGREREREDRFASEDICQYLASIPEGPWARWGKSRSPINQTDLSILLKRFGIEPKNIRFANGSVKRGYDRLQFEDSWERYLPSRPH